MSATDTREPPPQPAAGGRLRALYDRFRHLIHELGKFGVVGSVAFMVDTALYAFLLTRPMEPLTAKTLATVVSTTVAFLGNRFWTWRHRERSGLAREYGLYFFFNVVGLGIALSVLWLSHYGLGSLWPEIFHSRLADLIAAQILGTALGTLFRFWSYRRFVFMKPAESAPQVPGPTTDSSWQG